MPDYQQSIVLGPDYLPSWCPDFRKYSESWKPMYGNFFAPTPSDFGLIGGSRPAENLDVLTAFGHSFDTVETIEPRNADGKFGPTSDPRFSNCYRIWPTTCILVICFLCGDLSHSPRYKQECCWLYRWPHLDGNRRCSI